MLHKVDAWERQGLTTDFIGISETVIAVFAMGDQPRPESKRLVASLRSDFNLNVVMLTGDSLGAAQRLAADVKVDSFYAGLSPTENVENGKGVCGMVEDGTNDAPALAIADVGMSISGIGTHVALESADVVLARGNLMDLVDALAIGKACYKRVIENITFSILSKVAVLIVTFTVYNALWLAILVDVGGMLIVTSNSMRILSMAARRGESESQKPEEEVPSESTALLQNQHYMVYSDIE